MTPMNLYSRVSEADLQKAICDAATLFGWKIFSVRRSAVPGKRGPVSVVTNDGKGYPDLTLIHPVQGRILFIECKSEYGKITEDHKKWEGWIMGAHCEYLLARPSYIDAVIDVLRGADTALGEGA